MKKITACPIVNRLWQVGGLQLARKGILNEIYIGK